MHPHPERFFCLLTLYKSSFICYNSQAPKVYAPVAPWIEHRIPVPRVGGSSPFWRTKNRTSHAGCPVFAYAKGLEPSNAKVRWTFAKRRLDGVCSVMSRVPSGVPPGSPLFWYISWDSKGRRQRSCRKKESGGLFFRPWESPFPFRRIPLGMWMKGKPPAVQPGYSGGLPPNSGWTAFAPCCARRGRPRSAYTLF